MQKRREKPSGPSTNKKTRKSAHSDKTEDCSVTHSSDESTISASFGLRDIKSSDRDSIELFLKKNFVMFKSDLEEIIDHIFMDGADDGEYHGMCGVGITGDDDLLGFTTIVPLKMISFKNQVFNEMSKSLGISKDSVGLFINERMSNLPLELAQSAHRLLIEELVLDSQEFQSVREISHFLVVSPMYKQQDEVQFYREEEEIFLHRNLYSKRINENREKEEIGLFGIEGAELFKQVFLVEKSTFMQLIEVQKFE